MATATATETRKRRRSTRHSSGDFSAPDFYFKRPQSTSQQTAGTHDITFDHDEFADLVLPNSSIWHEGPLIVAILPCLGAFIFGTEYVQDIILLICVGWYLRICIRLPWSLYELSRPRVLPKHVKDNMSQEQRDAERSLERRSFVLLVIALFAPFFGLWLMRWILWHSGAADGGPYITYFHGTLFILFGGVRPINHVMALVAGSTRELHGRVHHPPPKTEEEENLELKVERMEMLLSMLTEKLREQEMTKQEDVTLKKQGMLEVQDNFEKTAARLEDGARRREKKSEMAMEMIDRRVEGLEKQYEALVSITLKEREAAKRAEPTLAGLLLKWLDWIEDIMPLRLGQRRHASHPPNSYYSPTSARMDLRRLAANGAGSGSSNRGSTSGGNPMPRRRSYDAPGPNLDTVVEEGPELDVDIRADGDTGMPMIDIPKGADGNSPELTIGTNGVRKRSKITGLDNPGSAAAAATGASSSQGASARNANSQFLRVPAEGSKHSKPKGNSHSKSGGGDMEG